MEGLAPIPKQQRMTELPAAFVAALEAERDALNARFAQRARSGSRMDREAFLQHLRELLAPLAGQIQAVLPERTRSVVVALYDVSLDLFAASLLGPDARTPLVRQVWTDVLPSAITLLARQPQQVAGCLCNAVVHVSEQRGTRPESWLTRMSQAAPHCGSVAELLEVGKVAAWQAGMVQYRQAALAALGKLSTQLAAALLGLPQSAFPQDLAALLRRLENDRWLTAEAAGGGESEPVISCVAAAGAFVGYGGEFFRPPLVSLDDQRLLVWDSKSQWELLADAYGVWLRRIGDAPAMRLAARGPSDVSIDRHGMVRWGKLSLKLPHLAQASSFACDGSTLAVTLPTSHHVFLFSTGSSAA